MSFAAATSALHAATISTLGTDAVYDYAQIKVIFDRSAQQLGEYGQVVALRSMISARKTDLPAPQRGEEIMIEGQTYTLDGIAEDDGHIVKVWLK